MTYTQPDLFHQSEPLKSFHEATLRPHNSRDSQRQADENYKHFAGQTLKVFDSLMNGELIDGDSARLRFKCKDVRARIHSIRKAGYKVSDRVMVGSHGCKEYFCSPRDIVDNRCLLMSKKDKG